MFDTNIDNHFSAQTYKNNPVRNQNMKVNKLELKKLFSSFQKK